MTNRAIAMRYARALLEVSQQDGDPERVEQELSGFAALLDEHAALRRVFENPAVPASVKRSLVGELVARLDGVSPVTVRLLTLLAERDRLPLFDEILVAFRERLMEKQGVVRAPITTAAALSADRVRTIAANLEAATGKRVRIHADVDATLIGGLVTQIGSTVYDGSIAHHLARLKERLSGEA